MVISKISVYKNYNHRIIGKIVVSFDFQNIFKLIQNYTLLMFNNVESIICAIAYN